MIEKRFRSLWEQLHGKNPHPPHFLEEIHLKGIRGINDLRVLFDYPVSVIAGSNASGKSTLLFAAACGYKIPGAGVRDFVPSTLFSDSRPKPGGHEDESAEGILQGVFDVLLPRRRIRRESVRIRRNTGASEFPTDVTAFRKFGQIQNFAFILDGDKCTRDTERKVRDKVGSDVPVFFLPSRDAPEIWVWDRLRQNLESAATELRLSPDDLSDRMNRLDSVYDSAPDPPSRITKAKLRSLSEPLPWRAPDICRVVSRLEADKQASGSQPLVEALEFTLLQWSAK